MSPTCDAFGVFAGPPGTWYNNDPCATYGPVRKYGQRFRARKQTRRTRSRGDPVRAGLHRPWVWPPDLDAERRLCRPGDGHAGDVANRTARICVPFDADASTHGSAHRSALRHADRGGFRHAGIPAPYPGPDRDLNQHAAALSNSYPKGTRGARGNIAFADHRAH
jgi:hypothetical protein